MGSDPMPWNAGETPEEEEARREAYRRLRDAATRVGVSLERLHALLARVAANEVATRRFLAEEVYQVSDDNLDEFVRVRIADLREPEER
jgi:DNA-binding response OmpR family regulator